MRATSFLSLKFGILGLLHQFASAVTLGFPAEHASPWSRRSKEKRALN